MLPATRFRDRPSHSPKGQRVFRVHPVALTRRPPASVSCTRGSPVSVQTDSNGFASLQFIPGTFVTYIANPVNYNATATGTKTVTASWTNGKTGQVITGTVTFTWKNYPYLTVTTLLDKTSAKVGDLLRVTITVTGNGAALQPKPIDVVLCLDRSGSMLENYPDRMVASKSAASVFASCLTYGKDQIGIVSFGDTTDSSTNGWAKLAPVLTSDGKHWNWS